MGHRDRLVFGAVAELESHQQSNAKSGVLLPGPRKSFHPTKALEPYPKPHPVSSTASPLSMGQRDQGKSATLLCIFGRYDGSDDRFESGYNPTHPHDKCDKTTDLLLGTDTTTGNPTV